MIPVGSFSGSPARSFVKQSTQFTAVSLMTVVVAEESSVGSVQKDRGSWININNLTCDKSQVPATTTYSQFGSTSVICLGLVASH